MIRITLVTSLLLIALVGMSQNDGLVNDQAMSLTYMGEKIEISKMELIFVGTPDDAATVQIVLAEQGFPVLSHGSTLHTVLVHPDTYRLAMKALFRNTKCRKLIGRYWEAIGDAPSNESDQR